MADGLYVSPAMLMTQGALKHYVAEPHGNRVAVPHPRRREVRRDAMPLSRRQRAAAWEGAGASAGLAMSG
jgi:hypothetical protein